MPKSALIEAVEQGNLARVESLLEQTVQIDEVNEIGNTPLMVASKTGQLDIVNVLLVKGANVTLANKIGLTALHLAAAFDQKLIIPLLLQYGASLTARNNTGRTPLHVAVGNGGLNAVKLLLKAGASLEEKTQAEETPLLIAAGADQLEVFQWLLKQGANLGARTKTGETAVEIALRNQRHAIVLFMADYVTAHEKKSPAVVNTSLEKLAHEKSTQVLEKQTSFEKSALSVQAIVPAGSHGELLSKPKQIDAPITSTHFATKKKKNRKRVRQKVKKAEEHAISLPVDEQITSPQEIDEQALSIQANSAPPFTTEVIVAIPEKAQQHVYTDKADVQDAMPDETIRSSLETSISSEFSEPPLLPPLPIQNLLEPMSQLQHQVNRLQHETSKISHLEKALANEKHQRVALEKTVFDQRQQINTFSEMAEHLQQDVQQLQKIQAPYQILKKRADQQSIQIHSLEGQLTEHIHSEQKLQERIQLLEKENALLQKNFQISKHLNQQLDKQAHDIQQMEEKLNKQAQLLVEYTATFNSLQLPISWPGVTVHSATSLIASAQIPLPQDIITLLHYFVQAGYFAFTVGGILRDLLTGQVPADIDIITNMPSEELLSYFESYTIQSNPHIEGLHQMTFAGIEIDIIIVDTAVFTSQAALIKDAEKRVFTINALYGDLAGNIYDPLQQGLKDLLEKPLLNIIGDEARCFEQDPLLLLRAVRLVAHYQLSVSTQTQHLIKQCALHLTSVNAQRLHHELRRHFLRGQAVMHFNYLIHFGLFEVLFPKTSHFLQSTNGKAYYEWIIDKLQHTDQRVNQYINTSIAYIYALFLTGSALSQINVNKTASAVLLEKVIEKTVNDSLQNVFNVDHLKTIKRLINTFIQKGISPVSSHWHLPKNEIKASSVIAQTNRSGHTPFWNLSLPSNEKEALLKRAATCPELTTVLLQHNTMKEPSCETSSQDDSTHTNYPLRKSQ